MCKELNVNVNGNKKLVNTADTRFMIWNIPAVATCPFRTPHCESFCYARKAENCYPKCLPYRQNNFEESLKDSFEGDMIWTISKRINSRAFKGKKCLFRIHESGDFYHEKYLDKWLHICRVFEKDPRIKFLAYTKSVRYLVGKDIPSNLVIRFSIWDDTKPQEIEVARDLHLPIYTADTEENVNRLVNNGYTKCQCEDCATCGKCYSNEEKRIVCVIH